MSELASTEPAWHPLQAGKGSATLSMAYAAAKFGESCLLALSGRQGVVECAYVESHLTPLPFFASRVVLGPDGVQARAHWGDGACLRCCLRTHKVRTPSHSKRCAAGSIWCAQGRRSSLALSCSTASQEYLPLGRFSAVEESGFEALKAELAGSIKKGVDFVVSGELRSQGLCMLAACVPDRSGPLSAGPKSS